MEEFPQVETHKEITCKWLFQPRLSECWAEEGTSSSGNNLGLDRLSNLFIDCAISAAHLPTSTSMSYLLTATQAFAFHTLWIVCSETRDRSASVCRSSRWAFLCLCLWHYMELPIHSEYDGDSSHIMWGKDTDGLVCQRVRTQKGEYAISLKWQLFLDAKTVLTLWAGGLFSIHVCSVVL